MSLNDLIQGYIFSDYGYALEESYNLHHIEMSTPTKLQNTKWLQKRTDAEIFT